MKANICLLILILAAGCTTTGQTATQTEPSLAKFSPDYIEILKAEHVSACALCTTQQCTDALSVDMKLDNVKEGLISCQPSLDGSKLDSVKGVIADDGTVNIGISPARMDIALDINLCCKLVDSGNSPISEEACKPINVPQKCTAYEAECAKTSISIESAALTGTTLSAVVKNTGGSDTTLKSATLKTKSGGLYFLKNIDAKLDKGLSATIQLSNVNFQACPDDFKSLVVYTSCSGVSNTFSGTVACK